MSHGSLFSTLSRLRWRWSGATHNVDRSQPQHQRLNLEQLEPRVLLTTAMLNPTMDNTLFEDISGNLSNGAGDNFFVGTTNGGLIRRGLIAFDISSIPTGSTIDSASL